MRTKILKYFGMVVVLIIMVNLTSCEVSIESWYDDDDYSEIYYRTTRELCSRTWQETWEQDGEYYTQRLDFYENRTGTDIIQIEHRNGYVTEDRYNFEWRWDNSATLSKILCKWKQDSAVSLFLYLDSVFKNKHKLIHNQAPVMNRLCPFLLNLHK